MIALLLILFSTPATPIVRCITDHTTDCFGLEILSDFQAPFPWVLFIYHFFLMEFLIVLELQVNQAISGIHGVDVQFAGINFLESLVYVFLWIISS